MFGGTTLSGLPDFPGFPAAGGLPAFDPSSPVTACSSVSAALLGLAPDQLSGALATPAAQFCRILGLLPTGLGGDQSGTATEQIPPGYNYPAYYDDGYGRHYYGDCGCSTAAAPVSASQVSSVPTGGVNTGDGTYGP